MGFPGEPRQLTGSCLCGAVRYTIRGPVRDIWACHCRFCRRLHSHVAAYAACAPEDIAIEDGRKLRWYRSSPSIRRGFCGKCGAQMFYAPLDGGHFSIAAGTLDEPTGLKLTLHLCTAQKGDYYAIADDVPQLAGHPRNGAGNG
ncbi:GFA family protein [Labrys wisconsinensis]|uniref:CENP-V/GFA domain-containing protein n=1 Tax=Labrys wisconsinensis TaxID=425677 RepID=A0ABU0JJD3_9HYPH|nr:GFA family protein [Labrys wisconsinensis]MDQ0474397.1 hypothetical protein [Labrys wisconsinensis]